jgi:hypothetical protein
LRLKKEEKVKEEEKKKEQSVSFIFNQNAN